MWESKIQKKFKIMKINCISTLLRLYINIFISQIMQHKHQVYSRIFFFKLHAYMFNIELIKILQMSLVLEIQLNLNKYGIFSSICVII